MTPHRDDPTPPRPAGLPRGTAKHWPEIYRLPPVSLAQHERCAVRDCPLPRAYPRVPLCPGHYSTVYAKWGPHARSKERAERGWQRAGGRKPPPYQQSGSTVDLLIAETEALLGRRPK